MESVITEHLCRTGLFARYSVETAASPLELNVMHTTWIRELRTVLKVLLGITFLIVLCTSNEVRHP